MHHPKVTKEINLAVIGIGKYILPIIIYLWFSLDQQSYFSAIIKRSSVSFSIAVIIISLVFIFVLDKIFGRFTKKPEPEIIY